MNDEIRSSSCGSENLITGSPEAEELAWQPFSKKMLKNIPLLLQRAQLARLVGRHELGRAVLEDAIRGGGWKQAKLWWELVSLVSGSEDYEQIRSLWLASPKPCHSHRSILRAVARAAVVTGHHEECRALLRKLIVVIHRRMAKEEVQTVRKPSSAETDTFARNAALALIDLNRTFSSIGLKGFLISGTLLGKVRENGIIGWDKDIDVGFFSEDCSIDLENHFLGHGKFRLGRVDLTSERLRVIHQNGTWIDVFPHYMSGEKRWHDGTATRWWNTPFGLKSVEFLGIQQYIPDDPELYLDENYGDWRKPNPSFDARTDAPNVEVTDPDHFISLLYFALEGAIRNRKDVMRRRYIAMLKEQGEGDWLEKLWV